MTYDANITTGPVSFCHVIDNCTSNPLLYNSIKYSDRQRFDYQIISLRDDAGLREQMAEINIPVRSLGYVSRRDALKAFFRLYSIFRNERIKIVQTHLFESSLIGLAASRFARVPVTIFTGHHSSETPLYNRKLLTFVDGASGRFLAKHTIAPSKQMKEIFVRDLGVPASKVSVQYHGFDLTDILTRGTTDIDFRRQFRLTGKILFGAVGRLYRLKNFENLIRGFAEFAKDRDNIALAIVGAGDQTRLQSLINSLDLQESVFLTGPRTDIAAVMNSFDVLVHPSLAESFGMVFIEAFALAKPILSTSVGIAPEIIVEGENGCLMADGSVRSIVDGFARIWAVKHNWPQMGERGFAASQNFDVRKTQRECDNLYLEWLIKEFKDVP